MKRIILSAEKCLIEAARERARSEKTTVNEQFRRWLADYAQAHERMRRYEEVMTQLRDKLVLGKNRRGEKSMSADFVVIDTNVFQMSSPWRRAMPAFRS